MERKHLEIGKRQRLNKEKNMKKALRIIGEVLTALVPIIRKEKLIEDSVIVALETIIAILIIIASKL